MLTLALSLCTVTAAQAGDADDAGWGDFPAPSLKRPLGASILVHVPRMDRRRFGDLPVRFTFSAELLASLKDVASLDLACDGDSTGCPQ